MSIQVMPFTVIPHGDETDGAGSDGNFHLTVTQAAILSVYPKLHILIALCRRAHVLKICSKNYTGLTFELDNMLMLAYRKEKYRIRSGSFFKNAMAGVGLILQVYTSITSAVGTRCVSLEGKGAPGCVLKGGMTEIVANPSVYLLSLKALQGSQDVQREETGRILCYHTTSVMGVPGPYCSVMNV